MERVVEGLEIVTCAVGEYDSRWSGRWRGSSSRG